jgi:hypothetical protein
MLDLSSLNDRAALEWACGLHSEDPSRFAGLVSWHRAHVATNPGPRTVALLALSSPTESAALLRALLERCGVDSFRVGILSGSQTGVTIREEALLVGHERAPSVAVPQPNIPPLVLALLRLAPGDRDGALAALREAGR